MGETQGTAPRRQVGTVAPVAAAAVIVVVIVGVIVLLNAGGTSDGFDLSTSATIPSGHASAAVIHDGQTVTGAGPVVHRRGGETLFCPPVATVEGQPCPLGIRLTGPRLHDIGGLRNATITGVYHGASIAVTAAKPLPARPSSLGHDDVPCAAPDNGWPNGAVDLTAAENYRQAHARDVVLVAILHPSSTAAVAYVVTSGDPSAAGNALTKVYGNRLCVVRSPFSTAQLGAAKRLVDAHIGTAITDVNNGGGPTIDSHGRVQIRAAVPIVDRSFADLVDAQPAGIIQLSVWLRPAS
jgi:hypothetical protein